VDVPSSGSRSGSKSVSSLLSWADVSSVNYYAEGKDVCVNAYPAGKLTMLRHWALEVLKDEEGGVPGRGGIVSGVGSGLGSGVGPRVCCLSRLGGGALVPSRLQHVRGLCVVPGRQSRYPGIWFDEA
jgi:hypothetical protein